MITKVSFLLILNFFISSLQAADVGGAGSPSVPMTASFENIATTGTLEVTGETTFNVGLNSSLFPNNRGLASQYLSTDGAGLLYWQGGTGAGTQFQRGPINLANNTWTTIPFALTDIINDQLGIWNVGLSSFVIVDAGYYTITATGWFASTSTVGQRAIRFILNNAGYSNSDFGYVVTNATNAGFISANRLPITTSITMYLPTGSQVSLQAIQTSGDNLDFGINPGYLNYFSIVKN